MKYYECRVEEIRCVKMRYFVEADNPADAMEKATNGETVEENDLQSSSVVDRKVEWTLPKPNYIPPEERTG